MRDTELQEFIHFIGCIDRRLAKRALAELLARFKLKSISEDAFFQRVSCDVVTEADLIYLKLWLSHSLTEQGLSLKEKPKSFCPLLSCYLLRVIDRWEKANGMVPFVYRSSEDREKPQAVVLPFYVEPCEGSQKKRVVYECGRVEIEGLSAAWETAWQMAKASGLIPYGEYLSCRFPELSEKVTADRLEGRSAVAPFFIAIALYGLALDVPAYRWYASGDLQETSKPLQSIPEDGEWRAKSHLADQLSIDQKFLFLPDSWPEVSLMEWKHFLRDRFDRFAKPLDLEQIKHELEREEKAIHHGFACYAETHQKLDLILERFGDTDALLPRRKQLYQKVIQLKANVASHEGNPSLCIKLIEQLPQHNSFETCQKSIRYAVACTDLAQYQQAESLLNEVLEKADSLPELDALIVRRNALGTRGQLRMAQALEPIWLGEELDASKGKIKKEESLKDLEKALQLTRLLDEDRPKADLPDEARNLYYLFLWSAYFSPEEEVTGERYHQALHAAKGSEVSEAFVLRAAHLARYRAVIEGKSQPLPWWPDEEPAIPSPSVEYGWLSATTLKYQAAFLASNGKIEVAEKVFVRALSVLASSENPLFQFIHGTILLQAGESLREENPSLAKHYLTEAQAVFSQDQLRLLFDPASAVAVPEWFTYTHAVLAHDVGEGRVSPQMGYLY